jgi:two-component system sensor histidine kinase KdpD
VVALAVLSGLWPALTAGAASFLLVDYFFVPPVRTLTIADEQNIVNLLANVRLEPVRLSDAIEAAIERLHGTSPDRAERWDAASAGVDVLADWDRPLQVLDNLLANADRFGPGTHR